MGDIVFPFASFNQDATCDLMHLLAGGAGAAIVASVRRKLVVQRTVNDAERGRLRARAEEAEREKHERVAQVLGDCEARGKKSGARATTVRRVTPQPECQAVQKQQQQQQRVQPPAVAVLSASARPPSHVACPAGRVAPAAAGSAGAAPSPPAKPVHKSTSTPALKASSCGAGAASALAATPLRASDAAVAAARGGGLRALLLALLAERGAKGVSPNALRSLVKDVGLRVRAFRVPPFDELQREAKRLAEHVSPGIYVLHAWLHPEAEAALADAQTRAGGGGGGGRRRSVTPSHTLGGAGVQQASEGSPPNTTRGPGPGATGAKRRAESSPEGEAVEARRKRAASAPPAQQQVSGGSSGRARACSSGSRGSHDADDSWVVEHASRMPLPAPRISSREEYEAQARGEWTGGGRPPAAACRCG